MKSAVKAGIGIAALTGTAGALLEGLYEYGFARDGGPFLSILDSKSHSKKYYMHRDCSAEMLRRVPCRRYTMLSRRGQRLEGFYYQWGEKPSDIVVFMVHGFRSEHLETCGVFLDFYRSRGIDIFTCDHAAAGMSEGSTVGFGIYEAEDCLDWLKFLDKELGENVSVILQGFSMGGATVLKMSDRCGDRVKFIIDDSGFTSIAEIMAPTYGPIWPVMRALCRRRGGYDPVDTDVRSNLRACAKPILFVHGEEDRTVPFEMGVELYGLYGGEKDKLFVKGARHIEAIHNAPEAYGEKVDEFIRRYIG